MKIDYVDHMGTDLTVANAARRSYGKEFEEWSEVPRTPRGRSDRELVIDLAKEEHTLPFRHPHISISCDAPLYVARQVGKHQVGWQWSEVSRRYRKDGMEFYRIGQRWRRHGDVRQSEGELLPPLDQIVLEMMENEAIEQGIERYERALRIGVTPEQARSLLPQSMEVAWTWTGSLLAFWYLYRMRSKPDTQKETRDFVAGVLPIVERLFPVSWHALKVGHWSHSALNKEA